MLARGLGSQVQLLSQHTLIPFTEVLRPMAIFCGVFLISHEHIKYKRASVP